MSPEPERNVPLAPRTTWKIGGPADWYLEPGSEAELRAGLAWARERGLPVRILGRGSNVLISDAGLRGLVVCLRAYRKAEAALCPDPGGGPPLLEASAGVPLPRLAKIVAGEGYGGYAFYIGIPGTVGGAVVMNAGFGPGDERQTAHRCQAVQVMEPGGKPAWRPYADFHPVYRHTDLVDSGTVVLAARFVLRERAGQAAIRAATAGHLAMRREKQPLTRPTAGSVFKGTGDGTPAAVLIDRCGLKGLAVGGAQVSPKHANWIENTGGATAAEVRELIRQVRERVRAETGVELEPEVRFLD
jgi:UDP-N-acetylmuramate dehydrogenase